MPQTIERDTLPPKPEPLRRSRKFDIDREEVARTIIDDFNKVKSDRSVWEQKQEKWMEMLEGVLGARQHQPFGPEASANFFVPLAPANIIRQQAVLMNVVENGEVEVIGYGEEDEELARTKQKPFINWEFKEHMNALPKIDEGLFQFIVRGTIIGNVTWEQEWREGLEVETLSFPQLPPEASIEDQNAALAELLHFKVIEIVLKSGKFELVDMKSRGNRGLSLDVIYKEPLQFATVERTAAVEIYVEDDRVEIHIFRFVKEYEGPRLTIPSLEDWYISRDAGIKGLQNCNFILRRFVISIEEIHARIADGVWDLVDEDDLKKIVEGKDATKEKSPSEELRERQEGQEDSAPTQDLEEIEGFECFYLWDVNDDGRKEQVIFTVLKDSEVLVRAKRIEEVFRSGLRPVWSAPYIKRENSIYGRGLPELLERLQDMMNESMNILIDWGRISNAPVGVYRSASGFRPGRQLIEPGAFIAVDDVNDVKLLAYPNANQAYLFNLMGMLNSMAERLTSQGDLQSGRVPTGKSSALRTVGTTMALLQQSDIPTDRILKRFYYGLNDFFKIIWRLNEVYMSDEVKFRVVGDMGKESFVTIKRDELRGNYDFRFTGTTESVNREAQGTVAQNLLALVNNPLALQSGVTSEVNIYNAHIRALEAMAIKNKSLYVTKPLALVAGPIYSAEQVLNLLKQGERVKINPAADLQSHINLMDEYMAGPEFMHIPVDRKQLIIDYFSEASQALQDKIMRDALAEASRQGGNPSQTDGQGGVLTTANPPQDMGQGELAGLFAGQEDGV